MLVSLLPLPTKDDNSLQASGGISQHAQGYHGMSGRFQLERIVCQSRSSSRMHNIAERNAFIFLDWCAVTKDSRWQRSLSKMDGTLLACIENRRACWHCIRKILLPGNIAHHVKRIEAARMPSEQNARRGNWRPWLPKAGCCHRRAGVAAQSCARARASIDQCMPGGHSAAFRVRSSSRQLGLARI